MTDRERPRLLPDYVEPHDVDVALARDGFSCADMDRLARELLWAIAQRRVTDPAACALALAVHADDVCPLPVL